MDCFPVHQSQAGLAAVRFAFRKTSSLTLVAKKPHPIVPNANHSREIRSFGPRINVHLDLRTRHPCLPKASTRPTIAKPLRTTDQSLSSHSRQLQQLRPRIRMAAAPALFTTTTKPMTISRPAGAATLNKIDFNPGVRASGPGASTPVVIMHGLLGNSRNFQGWGTKLVKSLDKERRVFAVDMRNHGGSSHHNTMTYVDMADDVLGFLAEEGLSEAVLVGHSMGGKAAAMTALLHPQVVRGLVVMDIAPVSYSMVDSTNWGETKKIIEAIHKMSLDGVGSRRDADQRLSKDVVDPALRAFAVTNLDKDAASGRWDWRINIDVIQRSMGDLAQFDSRASNPSGGEGGFERLPTTGGLKSEELSPYTGDTLFVAGGNSRYIRSQHLAEIRNLFPTFVVSTIKGAGHWVHADNPEETLRLVKSFLDRPELP